MITFYLIVGIVVLVFIIYMFFRNVAVYRFKQGIKIRGRLYYLEGNHEEAKIIMDEYDRLPNYLTMLFKFWKPMKSFIPKDSKLLEHII